MTERFFTKREIDEIIYDQFNNFYRIYADDMSLGEKLIFSEIKRKVMDGTSYQMNKRLEK